MKTFLAFWQTISTKTRMTFVIVMGVVLVTLIITAGVTGNLDELIAIIWNSDG